MTWVKLPDDALEDPAVADLSAEALIDYLRTLGWSNRWARNGSIPKGITGASAEAWIDAGLATRTDAGVQLSWLMEHQPTADEIERRKAQDAERQARRRRHNAGDHSKCDPDRCRVLKAASRRDSDRDTARESAPPDPTLPDPTHREGGGEGSKGDDDGHGGPVVALLRRQCAICDSEFLGLGYELDGQPLCSRRCQERWKAA